MPMFLCKAKTVQRAPKPVQFVTMTLVAILLSSGCNSKTKATPENFTQALNAYFQERSECLLSGVHFPYATSDPTVTKQMNTLVKSQLLESSYESAVHTTRFTVARAGERY